MHGRNMHMTSVPSWQPHRDSSLLSLKNACASRPRNSESEHSQTPRCRGYKRQPRYYPNPFFCVTVIQPCLMESHEEKHPMKLLRILIHKNPSSRQSHLAVQSPAEQATGAPTKKTGVPSLLMLQQTASMLLAS